MFAIQRYAEIHETVNTERHENAYHSLALDDPANSIKSLNTCAIQSVHKEYINFPNLSDQNFSLVIVLSLF